MTERTRRWLGSAALVIGVMIVAAALFFFLPAPEEDVRAARERLPANAASIERGAYLARAADCAACHTLANDRPYAGGLAFALPMGTIHASNITPDRETGIGSWSDGDFVRALHRGVGRDGQNLYPAFPYASYARMTTEDALAIKDYLFSLRPERSRPPENRLNFPFDQRWLLRAWNLLFVPSPGQPPNDRGAYLADVLGHCGECHTPRNALYGLDDGRKYAGALAAGWYAYNISSSRDDGIGGWSDEQLRSYFASGHAPGRGAASGSMAEVVTFSTQHLTPADRDALVGYLRSVPPQRSEEPRANAGPPPAAGQHDALGRSIFDGACASCHAPDGEGVQHPHAALNGARTVRDPSATNLLQVLLRGSHLDVQKTGHVFMPSFAGAYTDRELAAVASYVLQHFGGQQVSISPQTVAAARHQTAQ